MGSHETFTAAVKHVLQVFQECQITYALAGGLAYSALVEPRATLDLDFLILLPNEAIRDFWRRLENHFESLLVHQAPMQFARATIWRAVSFQNGRELILDFLLADSPFHQNALQRALTLDFLGSTLKVVTLEDLVLLKKCANRPQDLADLAKIHAMFQETLDHAYLAYWAQALHLTL